MIVASFNKGICSKFFKVMIFEYLDTWVTLVFLKWPVVLQITWVPEYLEMCAGDAFERWKTKSVDAKSVTVKISTTVAPLFGYYLRVLIPNTQIILGRTTSSGRPLKVCTVWVLEYLIMSGDPLYRLRIWVPGCAPVYTNYLICTIIVPRRTAVSRKWILHRESQVGRVTR